MYCAHAKWRILLKLSSKGILKNSSSHAFNWTKLINLFIGENVKNTENAENKVNAVNT